MLNPAAGVPKIVGTVVDIIMLAVDAETVPVAWIELTLRFELPDVVPSWLCPELLYMI